MRLARAPLTLLTCVAVAGCAVGPNYARPSAPLSATFKEAAGWSPAAPGDTLDKGDWWTLFGDPVLNGLEAKVQASNQNVIAFEAAYRQARALVKEQRAALFPAIDLTGAGAQSGSGRPNSRTTNTYQASIGASWEIDVFGRIRRSIESAKASAQASEADLANATLAAQGELALDYFGLREADAEIDVDGDTVRGYARTLEITQNRVNAGTLVRSSLLQAQTQLYNAQANLAAAQQQRATFEHAIAVLIGEAPGNFSLARAPWVSNIPPIPPTMPSTLLQRRPDIAGAERRMAAANAQIGIAKAAYYPNLSLSGSYGFAASSLGSLFTASSALWSYGAQVAQTLFSGGARHAQVQITEAAYDQTVAVYRQTVLTALQNTENELIATQMLATQYDLRLSASTSADQAEEIINNQYRAGTVDYTTVFTAQVSAYAARLALVQTEVQRQANAIALIQSLGGGWRAPTP